VKLTARGHYGDHFGLLRDRHKGASCAGWIREALHGCLPRAGKDHSQYLHDLHRGMCSQPLPDMGYGAAPAGI